MLSPGGLQQRQRFIVARAARFAERVLLPELPDHFACTTEELRDAEPKLSLDEAMHKAQRPPGATPVHGRLIQKIAEDRNTVDLQMKIIS